jgi:hypothetical protein
LYKPYKNILIVFSIMNIFRRPFNININKIFLHKRHFSSKCDVQKSDLNVITSQIDVINHNIRMVYIVGLINIVVSIIF